MQPNNRSSFIPKKSIKRVERVRGKQVYILSYVSYAVFFASVVAVGAVYFYANLLQTTLNEKTAELATLQEGFNQANILILQETERRLRIAEYLFDKHVSVYTILTEFERFAVDEVLFRSFSYNRSDDVFARIDVVGGAERFDRVAFQNSLLKSTGVLSDAGFVGITKAGGEVQGDTVASTEEDAAADTPVTFTIGLDLDVDLIPFTRGVYAQAPVSRASNVSESNASADNAEPTADVSTDTPASDNAPDV